MGNRFTLAGNNKTMVLHTTAPDISSQFTDLGGHFILITKDFAREEFEYQMSQCDRASDAENIYGFIKGQLETWSKPLFKDKHYIILNNDGQIFKNISFKQRYDDNAAESDQVA